MDDTRKRRPRPRWLASRRDCLALPLLVIGAQGAVAQHRPSADEPHVRLTADSTIGDLLSHPAFAGFARRILPWDDKDYDLKARLDIIGALLPYHSHVDIPSTVAALNRLIEDAEQGRQIFFEIYSEAERRAEPAKAHAGLFFLRGKPGAPFAIIAPGGGFAYVGSVHEGFPYAAAISEAGLNAFVLKYRAGKGGTVATQDLAAAIGFVFRNAATLGVDTRGYSLWGSSAGARMAASIGSHGVAAYGGGPELPKPATVVMAYTAHSDHAAPSRRPSRSSEIGTASHRPPRCATASPPCARLGTEVDYREYPGVGHGFGLGIGTSAEGWIGEAIRFWNRHQSR
jgi:acetyl esterase/lipase